MEGWIAVLLRIYGEYRVKAAPNIASPHYNGLRAIAQLKGFTRHILVCMEKRRLRTSEGAKVYPVEVFLKALAEDTLWTVAWAIRYLEIQKRQGHEQRT